MTLDQTLTPGEEKAAKALAEAKEFDSSTDTSDQSKKKKQRRKTVNDRQDDRWRRFLSSSLNKDGKPRALLANAITAISIDREWSSAIGFNEFTLATTLLRHPPWERELADSWEPREWTDNDDIRMAEWLQRSGVHVSTTVAAEAVQAVARQNGFQSRSILPRAARMGPSATP